MDKGQKGNPNIKSCCGGQSLTKVQLLGDSRANISALTFWVNLFDCSKRG